MFMIKLFKCKTIIFIIIFSYLNAYATTLPENVWDFLDNYFTGERVSSYLNFNGVYEINLSNGLRVGILRNGKLSFIDGKGRIIENISYIPKKVVNRLEYLESTASILRIDKDWNIYHFTLNNSSTISIDSDGVLFNRDFSK